MLVDDHIVVRIGLKALINAKPDTEVVGEAGNGVEDMVPAAANVWRPWSPCVPMSWA